MPHDLRLLSFEQDRAHVLFEQTDNAALHFVSSRPYFANAFALLREKPARGFKIVLPHAIAATLADVEDIATSGVYEMIDIVPSVEPAGA